MTDPTDPLSTQISEILKQIQTQAPEVLEMGVRKVRTTAELQIAGLVIEWICFLVAIVLLSKAWRSWQKREAAYRAWREGDRQSGGYGPDQPSDLHSIWAVIAAIVASLLLFIVVIQIGWYLPDDVSYLLNARYYAALELIKQIRG